MPLLEDLLVVGLFEDLAATLPILDDLAPLEFLPCTRVGAEDVVGATDGAEDGAPDGAEDGAPEGAEDGASDGVPDGAGDVDGAEDGAEEGAEVRHVIGAIAVDSRRSSPHSMPGSVGFPSVQCLAQQLSKLQLSVMSPTVLPSATYMQAASALQLLVKAPTPPPLPAREKQAELPLQLLEMSPAPPPNKMQAIVPVHDPPNIFGWPPEPKTK